MHLEAPQPHPYRKGENVEQAGAYENMLAGNILPACHSFTVAFFSQQFDIING